MSKFATMKIIGTGKFTLKKGVEKEVSEETGKILIAKGAATQAGITTKSEAPKAEEATEPTKKPRAKKSKVE